MTGIGRILVIYAVYVSVIAAIIAIILNTAGSSTNPLMSSVTQRFSIFQVTSSFLNTITYAALAFLISTSLALRVQKNDKLIRRANLYLTISCSGFLLQTLIALIEAAKALIVFLPLVSESQSLFAGSQSLIFSMAGPSSIILRGFIAATIPALTGISIYILYEIGKE